MAAHPAPGGVLSRRRPELLLLVATAALVAFHYAARADAIGVLRAGEWAALTLAPLPPGRHFVWAGLLLGAVPVILARVLCGLGPSALGLGFGRVRHGLLWLAAGVPLAVIAARVGADSAAVRAVYPLDAALSGEPGLMLAHALRQLLYFFAWEMLFRGVLLFGLRDRIGAGPANAVQTALSAVAHFGRPLDETLAAIPAGLVFGWVDLRIGSVWYVALIHWIVGAGLDWFILRG